MFHLREVTVDTLEVQWRGQGSTQYTTYSTKRSTPLRSYSRIANEFERGMIVISDQVSNPPRGVEYGVESGVNPG